MTETLLLANAQQAHTTLRTLWERIKPLLLSGHRMVVTVKPETRSLQQNAMLHALLTEIAQTQEWAGRKWDSEVWKRLLTAAWCRAHGEQIMMLPALDGKGVDIVFRRTSEMDKAELSSLIEFVEAWRAERE